MDTRRKSSGSFYGVQPPTDTSSDGAESFYAKTHRPVSIRGTVLPDDRARSQPLKHDEESAEGHPAKHWDVIADFNNQGPRYSDAHHPPHAGNTSQHTLLSLVPDGTKPETGSASDTRPTDGMFVTVPALGPEWQRSELKSMTKAGRRQKKREARRAWWKAWNRGEIGLCGTTWFTKKVLVFLVFAICVVIAVVLAVTIPRVPSITFNSSGPLSAATGSFNTSIPTEFSRFPANFSFPANAEVQVDTTSNIIPLTFKSIAAQLWYPTTDMLVAVGSLGQLTLPAKSFPIIQIPLNFTYIAPNDTDPTWVAWYDACKNGALYTSGVRPGLNFELILQMNIAGLLSTYPASAQAANAACPVQLPINSV